MAGPSDQFNADGSANSVPSSSNPVTRISRRTVADLLQENIDVSKKIYERLGEVLQAQNASRGEQEVMSSKLDVIITQNVELNQKALMLRIPDNANSNADEQKVKIKMVSITFL